VLAGQPAHGGEEELYEPGGDGKFLEGEIKKEKNGV
jgi:hypothetical protein